MKPTLTLLYDASCPVCSLEMDHLRARNLAGTLAFIDMSVAGVRRRFVNLLAEGRGVVTEAGFRALVDYARERGVTPGERSALLAPGALTINAARSFSAARPPA